MSTRSWRYIPARSHFSLANLPFGILSFAQEDGKVDPRPAVAIGEYALDLRTFMEFNGFSGLPSFKPFEGVFKEKTLNAFAGLGRKLHREVRQYLRSVFSETTEFPQILKDNEKLQSLALRHLEDSRVSYHLPFNIGDYTDFYAGRNHAYNVGRMFRGPENALQPNYTHLPVGYHGRASSVIVSKGQNPRPLRVRRPCGQILDSSATNSNVPVFGPCKRLDFELELGAFLCKENIIGERIPITEAEEYIFGFVLLNDWSARDIQAWEYVPLGPFTAKNFATTISPWVVLADALEPFMCEGLESTTELLPYLQEQKRNNVYNINLEVDITTSNGYKTTITHTNSRNLLFSFPQMAAHHSVTGCPMKVGDLLGSGTISGTTPESYGNMLEQCQNGRSTITLERGEERKFLEDGDTITMRGWAAGKDGELVGFGECIGQIEPARLP